MEQEAYTLETQEFPLVHVETEADTELPIEEEVPPPIVGLFITINTTQPKIMDSRLQLVNSLTTVEIQHGLTTYAYGTVENTPLEGLEYHLQKLQREQKLRQVQTERFECFQRPPESLSLLIRRRTHRFQDLQTLDTLG